MDPIFNFAFVNHLLRHFPPPLALEVEALVKARGFDGLLLAMTQSKDATKFLHRAVAAAVQEAKQNPAQLSRTREKVMACVSIGTREIQR